MLIIDDQHANIVLLARLLREAGCERVVGLGDPERLAEIFATKRPDIVLVDTHIPGYEVADLLVELRALIGSNDLVPILMLTWDGDQKVKGKAMSLGATDFINKPFEATEVILRIRGLLQLRSQHLDLRARNLTLEQGLRERASALEGTEREALERLLRAAEFRVDATRQHNKRVGEMASDIATMMGLEEDEVDRIGRAAPLHDIGKLAIPDAILLKPGPLSAEEFERVKTHPALGAMILAGSSAPVLQEAESIALTHHERWDGTGYPAGLKSLDIPLGGRIVAVVDVFDALIHERPYKKAWSTHAALAEIRDKAGTQFDPDAVQALLKVQRKRTLTRRRRATSRGEALLDRSTELSASPEGSGAG